jgi:hypothetical protein
MNFDQSPKNNIDQEAINDQHEKLKGEYLELLKNAIENYNFQDFSYSDFSVFLDKNVQFERKELDKNTHNINLQSFTPQELKNVWDSVDTKMRETLIERNKSLDKNSREYKLIQTGKFKLDYDGKIIPNIANPVLISGVHGDEKTLPNETDKIRDFLEIRGGVSVTNGYINTHVNQEALDRNLRSFPENSDLNRLEIADSSTQEIKDTLIENISKLESPYILDMHNDNTLDQLKNIGIAPKPYAYAYEDIDETKNLQNFLLCQQLGINQVRLVPRNGIDNVEGSIVNMVSKEKENNGIILETNSLDENFISSKLGLRYLILSGAINNGSPSSYFQVEHSLGIKLYEPYEKEIGIVVYQIKDSDKNTFDSLEYNKGIRLSKENEIGESQNIVIEKYSFTENQLQSDNVNAFDHARFKFDSFDRVKNILNQEVGNRQKLNFDLNDIKATGKEGGSSEIFEKNGQIFKIQKKTLEDSKADLQIEKLKNGYEIVNNYLPEFCLTTEWMRKSLENGTSNIVSVQNKLPEETKFLSNTGLNIKMNDEGFSQLKKLVSGIEKMYRETGVAVDILTLGNIGFSEKEQKFYLFDFDPLIVETKYKNQLKNSILAESDIEHNFKTVQGTEERHGMSVIFENLDFLKSQIKFLKEKFK